MTCSLLLVTFEILEKELKGVKRRLEIKRTPKACESKKSCLKLYKRKFPFSWCLPQFSVIYNLLQDTTTFYGRLYNFPILLRRPTIVYILGTSLYTYDVYSSLQSLYRIFIFSWCNVYSSIVVVVRLSKGRSWTWRTWVRTRTGPKCPGPGPDAGRPGPE